MEAFALPVRVNLPECIKESDFLECNLHPKVVLSDFRKSLKKQRKSLSMASSIDETSDKPSKRSTNSTASPTLSKPKRFKSMENGKAEYWDPSVEYEVEKIVGYHRDKRKRMWYLVKWKNWSKDYNTFEPIANLTKCHYELMKFFEISDPTNEEIVKKNLELEEGLKKRSVYLSLVNNKYTWAELRNISREFPEVAKLFTVKHLDELENRVGKEYEYIVRCLIGMCRHQDPGLIVRGQNYKLLLMMIQMRRQQLRSNAAKEKLINQREKIKITIENKVDLEEFPNLSYIVDMKPWNGIVLSKEPLLSCECPDGCSPASRCCGMMVDSVFAYTPKGRLRTKQKVPIYECNSQCSCPESCPNRVVQRGRQVELCIFKTKSCGWGVKTMEKITRGAFVCEYIGELIPDSEAVVRDVTYINENKGGYLFDLDYFADDNIEMYCIDATNYGNVARFINHSCDPNLVVYPVWIDGLQPNLHRLAFFAKRNIQKGEEIRFDYRVQELGTDKANDVRGIHGPRVVSNVRCQCKAPNCREWVFGYRS